MLALSTTQRQRNAGLYAEPAAPKLDTGMAAPAGQKTIQPVPATPATAAPAQTPNRQTWDQLASRQFDLGQFGSSAGFNNQGLQNSFTNLAKTIGYSGAPLQDTTFNSAYEGESGTVNQAMQGQAASPEFLQALQNYTYSTEDTGDGRVKLGVFDQGGNQVGSYLHGTKDSGFDKFAEKAIPLGIAALGGAAFGGFIPGAELGAAGAGAVPAAGAAADIGALGLAEGVYGAGGALGAGAAPGTVGGLAGSTAGFGGLGSVLPGSVGFAAPGALAAGEFGLSTVGGPDPAGVVPGGSETPGVFNAAQDSQAYNASANIGGAEAAASATAPASVNLGSAGTYATGGGIVNNIANALEAAKVNPAGALASAGSSVLDFAKANPGLAAMGLGALGSLTGSQPEMPSTGGGSGSGGTLTPGAQQISDSLGSMDFSGLPGLQTSAGDRNTFNQSAIDAAYGQQTRYLDPQIQQQQRALEARLSEQGFVPGTPAYNQAMQNFMDTNQRAYASARDSSILQGTQIGQADYRNAISGATLNNSAAAQALEQYLAKRSAPINERNALLSGDQVVYGQQLDRYNAQVAESNNRNQALSQLALALGIYLG